MSLMIPVDECVATVRYPAPGNLAIGKLAAVAQLQLCLLGVQILRLLMPYDLLVSVGFRNYQMQHDNSMHMNLD
jgi:hypothetical protein